MKPKSIERLYKQPMDSTRGGVFFGTHSYPTKINADAIVPYILAHTKAGDKVFDGFAGSGSVGLAAALCSSEDQEFRNIIEGKIDSPQWGSRESILYDLSPLAAFISDALLDPVSSDAFTKATEEILEIVSSKIGWMYEAKSPTNEPGFIRYSIWSEILECPFCKSEDSYWNMAVSLNPVKFTKTAICNSCNRDINIQNAKRVIEKIYDPLLEKEIVQRKRNPVYIYGSSQKKTWERPVISDDIKRFQKVIDTPLPGNIPVVPMMNRQEAKWGEMHRTGYHQGISHLHHFYTKRNLLAVATIYDEAAKYKEPLRKALLYWASSYNATHSTLMTRAVAKSGSKNLVVTSAQSAALYISSMPVEKNILLGLRAKSKAIYKALVKMETLQPRSTVVCGSSTNTNINDNSIDYIFTDPPFGDNIQYSEINFISEAWLGAVTDNTEEAIVSKYQGKDNRSYAQLLENAFAENWRILKPGGYMTVVFHSSKSAVWEALLMAWTGAGFELVTTSYLNKAQGSFKQVTSPDAVSGDKILLLQKTDRKTSAPIYAKTKSHDEILDLLSNRILTASKERLPEYERTKQGLYKYAITNFFNRGQNFPYDAKKFFKLLDSNFVKSDDIYKNPDDGKK